MENYYTVKNYASASFTEKKSEFTGHVMPVSTNEEAVDFINKIRAENRKASHNVYAYILRHQNISRYSDDGEPKGTAGVPVLDVLAKEDLTDVCCVVTRYFGGVLLSGGGLVRAYSHSAKIAVDSSGKILMCKAREYKIITDYSLYGKISHIFPGFDVKITGVDFGADVTVSLLVKKEFSLKLEEKIIEHTNGKVNIIKNNELFMNFG